MGPVDYFSVAQSHAEYSTCARSKVGAVLVSPEGIVRSVGWNIEMDGLRCDKGQCPRGRLTYAELSTRAPFQGIGKCVAIHAEVMALQICAEWCTSQWTLYVTKKPCDQCREWLKTLDLQVQWPEGEPV